MADPKDRDERLAPIDFSTFLISLGSNVSVHLDPKHKAYDPVLAKQTIDILELLAEKTAGNRTPEEDTLLQGLLYQTRLAYCDAVKS